jgi:hypothetical protein
MQDSNSGDAGISVGQEDQGRDQAMEKEKQMRDAVGGTYGSDPTATPQEQRKENERAPARPVSEPHSASDEFHPGQAEQPDRDEGEGLVGLGPSQPD